MPQENWKLVMSSPTLYARDLQDCQKLDGQEPLPCALKVMKNSLIRSHGFSFYAPPMSLNAVYQVNLGDKMAVDWPQTSAEIGMAPHSGD